MKNIALMASGEGTNALNLIEAAKSLKNVRISCVVVDTDISPLPKKLAAQYPMLSVYRILPMRGLKGDHKKNEHEMRILETLKGHEVSWIFLAGYMRILGPALLNAYSNRIVNIHPSPLPLYPGPDSYRSAYEDGVKESGITIHLVDAGVDTGPVIIQEKFYRQEGDSLEDFVRRGKEVEWKLYPKILEKLNESVPLLPGV